MDGCGTPPIVKCILEDNEGGKLPTVLRAPGCPHCVEGGVGNMPWPGCLVREPEGKDCKIRGEEFWGGGI